MIKILLDVLAHILFIGLITCFFAGYIYLIIDSIREYLKDKDLVYHLGTIMEFIGVIVIAILILKVFGL